MHDQGYRARLRHLLSRHVPQAEVYDPLADHAQSLDYDHDTGREVFMHHNRLCGEVDVVVAFVPSASMGTAIEMWEAHRSGRIVVSVSPLAENWAIKFLSHVRYEHLDQFEYDLVSGQFLRRLDELRSREGKPTVEEFADVQIAAGQNTSGQASAGQNTAGQNTAK
jgi:hypothetical protein